MRIGKRKQVDSRAYDLRRFAMRQAASDDPDTEARANIDHEAGGDTSLASAALDLTSTIDTYVADRARRLLAAVAQGGPVHPIDADKTALYEWESNLIRLSHPAAFREIAKIEPRTNEVFSDLQQRRTSADADRVKIASLLPEIINEYGSILGPDSGATGLARSTEARQICISHTLESLGLTDLQSLAQESGDTRS